uniref:Uncharacterized protein n=1 Tax=Anguilla anguilla TaxID=7936 RepID=A0A0E9XHZ0_ANGAN
MKTPFYSTHAGPPFCKETPILHTFKGRSYATLEIHHDNTAPQLSDLLCIQKLRHINNHIYV